MSSVRQNSGTFDVGQTGTLHVHMSNDATDLLYLLSILKKVLKEKGIQHDVIDKITDATNILPNINFIHKHDVSSDVIKKNDNNVEKYKRIPRNDGTITLLNMMKNALEPDRDDLVAQAQGSYNEVIVNARICGVFIKPNFNSIDEIAAACKNNTDYPIYLKSFIGGEGFNMKKIFDAGELS